jgi:hypothetical protein
MSAVSSSAPAPLFHEGTIFWQQLIEKCRRNVNAINACAREHGVDDCLLAQENRNQLRIVKSQCPSTAIAAALEFRSWGPVISAKISGWEYEDTRFPSQEIELPLAKDLDGEMVAIFDEGRSFSPADLACYFAQIFHRCFPGIALPC